MESTQNQQSNEELRCMICMEQFTHQTPYYFDPLNYGQSGVRGYIQLLSCYGGLHGSPLYMMSHNDDKCEPKEPFCRDCLFKLGNRKRVFSNQCEFSCDRSPDKIDAVKCPYCRTDVFIPYIIRFRSQELHEWIVSRNIIPEEHAEIQGFNPARRYFKYGDNRAPRQQLHALLKNCAPDIKRLPTTRKEAMSMLEETHEKFFVQGINGDLDSVTNLWKQAFYYELHGYYLMSDEDINIEKVRDGPNYYKEYEQLMPWNELGCVFLYKQYDVDVTDWEASVCFIPELFEMMMERWDQFIEAYKAE